MAIEFCVIEDAAFLPGFALFHCLFVFGFAESSTYQRRRTQELQMDSYYVVCISLDFFDPSN
eukprot:14514401-Ditylum_brightwellii.AAC.1